MTHTPRCYWGPQWDIIAPHWEMVPVWRFTYLRVYLVDLALSRGVRCVLRIIFLCGGLRFSLKALCCSWEGDWTSLSDHTPFEAQVSLTAYYFFPPSSCGNIHNVQSLISSLYHTLKDPSVVSSFYRTFKDPSVVSSFYRTFKDPSVVSKLPFSLSCTLIHASISWCSRYP